MSRYEHETAVADAIESRSFRTSKGARVLVKCSVNDIGLIEVTTTQSGVPLPALDSERDVDCTPLIDPREITMEDDDVVLRALAGQGNAMEARNAYVDSRQSYFAPDPFAPEEAAA